MESDNELRIVRGNDFAILYELKIDGADEFDLSECSSLSVKMRRNGYAAKDVMEYAEGWEIVGADTIRVDFDGMKMKLGSYRIDISGVYEGKDWRTYSKDLAFWIVDSVEEANIPVGSFVLDGLYQIVFENSQYGRVEEKLEHLHNQIEALLTHSVYYNHLYKGEYVPGTTYEANSIVFYEDVLYQSKVETDAVPTDKEYWELA